MEGFVRYAAWLRRPLLLVMALILLYAGLAAQRPILEAFGIFIVLYTLLSGG